MDLEFARITGHNTITGDFTNRKISPNQMPASMYGEDLSLLMHPGQLPKYIPKTLMDSMERASENPAQSGEIDDSLTEIINRDKTLLGNFAETYEELDAESQLLAVASMCWYVDNYHTSTKNYLTFMRSIDECTEETERQYLTHSAAVGLNWLVIMKDVIKTSEDPSTKAFINNYLYFVSTACRGTGYISDATNHEFVKQISDNQKTGLNQSECDEIRKLSIQRVVDTSPLMNGDPEKFTQLMRLLDSPLVVFDALPESRSDPEKFTQLMRLLDSPQETIIEKSNEPTIQQFDNLSALAPLAEILMINDGYSSSQRSKTILFEGINGFDHKAAYENFLTFLGSQSSDKIRDISESIGKLGNSKNILLDSFMYTDNVPEIPLYLLNLVDSLPEEKLEQLFAYVQDILINLSNITAELQYLINATGGNKTNTYLDTEYDGYFSGINTAMITRLTQSLATAYHVANEGSLTVDVFRGENITEEVSIESLDQAFAGLELLKFLTSKMSTMNKQQLIGQKINNNDNVIRYSSFDPNTGKADFTIFIRPRQEQKGEARLSISAVLPQTEDAYQYFNRIIQGGIDREVWFNDSIHGGNSRSRELRTVAIRLDFEKLTQGLSLDMGSVFNRKGIEAIPLNNLLATVIAAGAQKISRDAGYDPLDNHVRETFDKKLSDPDKFAKFLCKLSLSIQESETINRPLINGRPFLRAMTIN